MQCLPALKMKALFSSKRLDLLGPLHSVTSKKTTLHTRCMSHCDRDHISRKVIPEPQSSPRAENGEHSKGIDLRPQRRFGCYKEIISCPWWKWNPIPYLPIPLPSLRDLCILDGSFCKEVFLILSR